jgi:hypothetical protein
VVLLSPTTIKITTLFEHYTHCDPNACTEFVEVLVLSVRLSSRRSLVEGFWEKCVFCIPLCRTICTLGISRGDSIFADCFISSLTSFGTSLAMMTGITDLKSDDSGITKRITVSYHSVDHHQKKAENLNKDSPPGESTVQLNRATDSFIDRISSRRYSTGHH